MGSRPQGKLPARLMAAEPPTRFRKRETRRFSNHFGLPPRHSVTLSRTLSKCCRAPCPFDSQSSLERRLHASLKASSAPSASPVAADDLADCMTAIALSIPEQREVNFMTFHSELNIQEWPPQHVHSIKKTKNPGPQPLRCGIEQKRDLASRLQRGVAAQQEKKPTSSAGRRDGLLPTPGGGNRKDRTRLREAPRSMIVLRAGKRLQFSKLGRRHAEIVARRALPAPRQRAAAHRSGSVREPDSVPAHENGFLGLWIAG